MYNIFLIVLAVNVACWIVQVFNLVPFSLPPEFSPTDIASMFTLNRFLNNFLYSGVAVVAGLATLLLRQNTFALYALVIFIVGLFLPLVSGFITAIPRLIEGIMALYPAYNPFEGSMLGFTNPYSIVIMAFGAFAAFMFIVGQVSGREVA
jgi:hypothetical protein